MTESMIERVARALAEHGGDNWETCLKAPGQRRAGMYRSMARAAITAMRDPTEAMVDAVGSNWGPGLERSWDAMIDAALR